MANMESLLQRLSKDMVQSGIARSARIQVASRLETTRPSRQTWSLSALSGKTALLTGPARLSAVLLLVHEAQSLGGIPLWISASDSSFHPPDVARMGIDLSALPLARISKTEHPRLLWRILHRALSSEAFSLVILDGVVPGQRQSQRLVRSASEHGTALIFIAPFPDDGSKLSSGRTGKPIQILSTRRIRLDGATFLTQLQTNRFVSLCPSSPKNGFQAGLRLAALPELTDSY